MGIDKYRKLSIWNFNFYKNILFTAITIYGIFLSCKRVEDKSFDKIRIKNDQMDSIRYLDIRLKELMDTLSKRSGTPIFQLGFIIYNDSTYYLRNCLDYDSQTHIPIERCKMDDVLKEEEKQELILAMEWFNNNGFSGAYFESVLQQFVYTVRVDYNQRSDTRMVAIINDTTGISKTCFRVIDYRIDIALLRERESCYSN